MILVKSFYCVIGMLVGLVVVVVFVGLFVQILELFLLVLVLWIGFCIVGLVYNCNFCFYGFVFFGYMVVLIGLFLVLYLVVIFDLVMMWVSEIMVGIVCVGLVSVLVFLQVSVFGLVCIICGCFIVFVDMVSVILGGIVDCKQLEVINVCFVGDIIGLEVMCSLVIFEDFEVCLCSGCFFCMNSEFMVLLICVYVLYQLMNWLYVNLVMSVWVVIEVILFYYCEVQFLFICVSGELVMSVLDVVDVVLKLDVYKWELLCCVWVMCYMLFEQCQSDSVMLDFDMVFELFYCVIEELYVYMLIYVLLIQCYYECE